MRFMKKYITLIMIVSILGITSGCGTELSKVASNHSAIMLHSLENKAEAKSFSVDKPNVEKLTSELINRIVQDTDDQNMVKEFTTKKDMEQHLQEVASSDLVSTITDVYFEEREGGLYLVPTELFPWVNTDQPYELKQMNDFEYQLIQSNESDLNGSYTIEINFLYENNHWIIKNFTIN